jgi:hypothetical protein
MPHALGTAVFRKSRRWSVDDSTVADLTARVALYLRQVCSRNYPKRIGRLGPHFDFWTMGDRHSTTHLLSWLQLRLLVSQKPITSLDQRPVACCWRNIASLTMSAVKQFSSTLQHALVEGRNSALVEAVAFALPT